MKDINGKEIKNGHIVAVRYVWNSYVGEVRKNKLSATGGRGELAFFSDHSLDSEATYQILSHRNPDHEDYNKESSDWYKSETEYECPVKIRVYENMELK